MKTLMVGQNVRLLCGNYACGGEVVRVTPEGVEVRTENKTPMWFDNNGKGYIIVEETYDCPGPWYIELEKNYVIY